ncbi:DUF2779 domain-containing protein [Pseudomonadales bacterium]|nr:DUF2779 domain-containing protein [Pseudomonadales bacterium]
MHRPDSTHTAFSNKKDSTTQPRYLTKSRFKLGLECPTKLFYTAKKDEYADIKLDDPFLNALASGGYQVGELAKHYYPGGHDITTLDYAQAQAQTQQLLLQENVVIFEPAIRVGNLFIRIDILEKKGNHINLIEVKSKSIDLSDDDIFWNKNKKSLDSQWKPYLLDVAFQHHVLMQALPHCTVSSFLMLANKNAAAPTDGLNQKFRVVRDNNRKGVQVSDTLTPADLKPSMLCLIDVYEEVAFIHNDELIDHRTFAQHVDYLSTAYANDQRLDAPIGNACKKCEFKTQADQSAASLQDAANSEGSTNLKSGFKECWQKSLGWSEADFAAPNILEIWKHRGTEKLLANNKIKLRDLEPDDLGVDDAVLNSSSLKDRQWLQVVMRRDSVSGTGAGTDAEAYFDQQGFVQAMQGWTYPLHFIDFETTTVALPFTKGRKPYETVGFQFSHHVYYENGTIEHKDEYLNAVPGQYPNIDFVRALKVALEGDEGTIFRYAAHENTVLNHIHKNIEDDRHNIADADELLGFIESITHSASSARRKWRGKRDMVDMLKMVTDFYYHPNMKGSNSIKVVLPAVLNSSAYVQSKYAQPIYGRDRSDASDGTASSDNTNHRDAYIPSANFKNFTWVQYANGQVVDPYQLLPTLFDDISPKNQQLLCSDDSTLNNGGAALTAYGKLQFEEMTDYERQHLEKGLLQYCELDTFAMVLIFEAWKHWGEKV